MLGGLVELVDTRDSKSLELRFVSVRVRYPLPIYDTFKVKVMGYTPSSKTSKHNIYYYWEPIMKKKGLDIMKDFGGREETKSNIVYYCFACSCPDNV